MYLLPILLLGVLFVIVFSANSMKKKGQLSESGYQKLLSASSILVTIVALLLLFLRLRGRQPQSRRVPLASFPQNSSVIWPCASMSSVRWVNSSTS